ncbi:hypothetical protein GCM10009118_23830 [Wandonia haliotis]|uniref:Uncharacterized protein n=1 Tax=Wandonia haliotis TaxID=574963 RepID=A0ABP3Y331_9FLAO
MLSSILLIIAFIFYLVNIILAFISAQKREDGKGKKIFFKRTLFGLFIFVVFGILLAILGATW